MLFRRILLRDTLLWITLIRDIFLRNNFLPNEATSCLLDRLSCGCYYTACLKSRAVVSYIISIFNRFIFLFSPYSVF